MQEKKQNEILSDFIKLDMLIHSSSFKPELRPMDMSQHRIDEHGSVRNRYPKPAHLSGRQFKKHLKNIRRIASTLPQDQSKIPTIIDDLIAEA
jgi:hypothetical protein